MRRCPLRGSPVLGFTSKRGKLLLDMSSRMRCPALNRLDVGYSCMVSWQTSPGFISSCFSSEFLNLARMIPSSRFMSIPTGESAEGGCTSISLAVKSVSTAEEEAQSFTSMGPVISTSPVRGGVTKTSTSRRAESGRESLQFHTCSPHFWSHAPWSMMPTPDEMFPPMVGTGLRGSKS